MRLKFCITFKRMICISIIILDSFLIKLRFKVFDRKMFNALEIRMEEIIKES